MNGENLDKKPIFIPVKEHNVFNTDKNSDPANSSR